MERQKLVYARIKLQGDTYDKKNYTYQKTVKIFFTIIDIKRLIFMKLIKKLNKNLIF